MRKETIVFWIDKAERERRSGMEKLNALCLLVCLISLTTGLGIIIHHVCLVSVSSSMFELTVKGFFVLVFGVLTLCFYDMHTLRISHLHTVGSMLEMYLAYKIIKLMGYYGMKKLNKESSAFRDTQERLLLQILGANANTEYGKLNRFSQIKDREMFRREHPLTRYQHYEAYMDRIVDGETNVLTTRRLLMIAMSSGTTGKAKTIPLVKESSYNYSPFIGALFMYTMMQKWSGCEGLKKMMRTACRPYKQLYTKTGIFMGAVSAYREYLKGVMFMYTEPDEVTDLIGEPQTLYLHLLFALSDRYVWTIAGSFASGIFHVCEILESEWHNLANDIETGTIKNDLDIDVNIRNRLQAKLRADPERADEIRRECRQGFSGIIKRLWPTMPMVVCLTSGSQGIYYRNLKEHACKGLSLYSGCYMASEGFFGLNINPTDEDNQGYVLVASCVFFEFIKIEESHEDQPTTFFAEQVEIGKEYEVAITTWSGLCRYRYGDVVRILGFYKQAPVVQFSYRIGQMLNVCSEKTSEEDFSRALSKAESRWRHCKVIDYCCAESILMRDVVTDFTEEAPHYVVLLELAGCDHPQLSQEEKNYIDEALRTDSYVYESFRKKGSIGPMHVLVVQEQTFRDLKSHVVSTTTTSAVQYKVPRVVTNAKHLKFMLDRVVG